MSYPWPSATDRRARGEDTRAKRTRLAFESLESRILLSAEIGIPPNDPFADELLKDRYAALESRLATIGNGDATTMAGESLQSAVATALEPAAADAGPAASDIPRSWILPGSDRLDVTERGSRAERSADDPLRMERWQAGIDAERWDALEARPESWAAPVFLDVSADPAVDPAAIGYRPYGALGDFRHSGVDDTAPPQTAADTAGDSPAAGYRPYGALGDFRSGGPGDRTPLPGSTDSGAYDAPGAALVLNALIPAPMADGTTVTGTAGSDVFENDGNDTTFEGLAGNDVYLFTDGWGSDTVVEDADAGSDTLDFSDVTANLTFTFSADGSIGVSDGINTVAVAGNVERLIGGRGNDRFVFNAGAAFAGTLAGGGGDDTLDYGANAGGVTVDLGAGSAAGTSGVSDIENVVGSAFDDVLRGDSGDNALAGGLGNDVLDGGAGNDLLQGGGGSDTANYARANAGVAVDLGITGPQATGGAGSDTLESIENLTGSAFDDTLSGDGGANVLDGGDGTDTLSYAGATAGVIVELGLAGSQDTVGDGSDTLSGFENLTGSAFDDVLVGGTGDNVLVGGDGNDQIIGGGGADTVTYADAPARIWLDLVAGTATVDTNADDVENPGIDPGDDEQDTLADIANVIGSNFDDTFVGDGADNVFDGGAGTDTVSYAAATAGVTVRLDTEDAQNTVNAGTDTLAGFENLVGSDFNDTLSGNDGDNVLDGGGGTDTLSYATAAAGVVVDLSDLAAQDTGGAGSDTLSGFENLTGSAFDDTLAGDDGDNVLDGGDGTDTLSYAGAAAGVTVDLGLAGSQDTVGAGSDTIAGFENLAGSDFDDTFTGDAGDNVIAGGAGNDTLTGGGGNNTVSYAGAAGAVTVDLGDAAAQDTLGDGTDTLTQFQNVIGTGYGIGPGLGDTLTGDVGDNAFFVAAGADATIDGGPDPGVDRLVVDGRGLALTGSAAGSLEFGATTITYTNIDDVTVQNASTAVDVDLLLQGLRELAERFEELEAAGDFADAIPLADPLGASFGELQNFGRVLTELADDFEADFIAPGATRAATSIDVADFLAGWAIDDLTAMDREDPSEIIDGTESWSANTLAASQRIVFDAGGAITEIRFVHSFTSDRVGRFDLSLSDALRDADVAVARDTFLDFASGFDLDLEFGLLDYNDTTGSGTFFVDEAMQLAATAALPDGLPVDILANTLIGFMEGTVSGTIDELTASADGVFAVTDGIRTLTELEVPDSIDVDNVSSAIDTALDFTTAPGFTIANLGDGVIDFANSDFLALGVDIQLPENADEFGLISPNELLRMLDQLGGWLSGLARSGILDLNIPFAGDTTVGDLLEFGEAFGDELLRFLVRHDGLALSGDALDSGILPAGNPLTFGIDVETAAGERSYTVELDPAVTFDNDTNGRAEALRQDVADAIAAAIGDDAIAADIEVFLEGGRIGLRPAAGAAVVTAVSIPLNGNETLQFDGKRLIVPTALRESGVLGHELEFTLNVGELPNGDPDERVIAVSPDSTNTTLDDLVNDINAALRDAGLSEVSAALAAGSRTELAFSVADDSAIGAAILVGVRNPSTLADGLNLGVEAANFPSAQDLADRLSEILSGIVGGITVDFVADPANDRYEMSFTVSLEREFDIASLPIDLSVDLGDFIEIESFSDLGVTANAGLDFTFGVNLFPSESLVVAPPVSTPDVPDNGVLTDTANFTFTLLQQNFEPDERLSGDNADPAVGALNVGGFTVTANDPATAVTWSPRASVAANGELVEVAGGNDRLPDQHFILAVDDGSGPSFVDGVLLSFDTIDNADLPALAQDLEDAINAALLADDGNPLFGDLAVTIANADGGGFDISATGSVNYGITLETADEFAVAADVAVAVDPVTGNASIADLLADVQDAIDEATMLASLERIDDTLLGLTGQATLTDGALPVIGEIAVPENGVLDRDVRFEVDVGGEIYRGVVSADSTVDNEQENSAQRGPIVALAEDVASAINRAIGTSGAQVTVTAHPPLGQAEVDLNAATPTVTTDSPVLESGVLDQDVAFTLTTATGTVISATLAVQETEDNLDVADLATDIEAAIAEALDLADVDNVTVGVTAEGTAPDYTGRLIFALGAGSAGLVIDFSETEIRRLEYSVTGADASLHFISPAVVAEFTGNRIGLFTVPVLAQPDDGSPGKLLSRRIAIDADATDTAFTELGLLSSPIPDDGVLSGTAQFLVVVDGAEPTIVTVYDNDDLTPPRNPLNTSNTSDNDSVDDLIDDINTALAAEPGTANVQVRRVTFGDTMMTDGNRFEFFTTDGSGIEELTLPALDTSIAGQGISIRELGFSEEDDHSARVQSGEFFIRDAALSGGLSLDASNVGGSAVVGFGGAGGLGLGVSIDDSAGSIFGDVSISLVNPDYDAATDPVEEETRITLDTLWRYIADDDDQRLTDLVSADISGGVDIDLNVAPVLPIRTPIEPANVAIDLVIEDWLDPDQQPSLDDATAPNGLNVNVSGLDLDIYDALSNLTFSDVVDALQDVLSFLRDLQGVDENGNGGGSGALAAILDEPLPLLNQSATELLVVAEDFAALVDEVIANPSDSLEKLELLLEDLLGLPKELVTLGIDFDDGLALRVDLVFRTGVEESLGFDLDIADLVDLTDPGSAARDLLEGVTGLVGVSSTGDLSVGVDGTVRLSFGIALGNGNGSAEALGFRDGATSENGILTATGDAQAAADRLVDQDIEFLLELDDDEFTVVVTAGETDDTTEVTAATLLADLDDAPTLQAGADIRVTLLDGRSVDINLDTAGALTTIQDVLDAINDATVSGTSANLDATFNDARQRIEIRDTNAAAAGSQQSGVYVTQTDVDEFAALQFSLQVGLTRTAVPVTVDAASGITRKQWLASIDEAIRQAMVDAGQLNPVADAMVDVTYNGVIRQLTFQGTGDGFGERLTITRGGVFSIADIGPADAADTLGLAGADDNGDRVITGKKLKTDDPADAGGLAADVQRGINEALAAAGDTRTVDVVMVFEDANGDIVTVDPDPTDDDVGRLELRSDPATEELTIRSISQTFAPFLYNGPDGTAFIIDAGASGANLEFTAQVGPFGFFVIDGTASLDAFFQVFLEDTGDTDERRMDGRTFFGQDDFDITTDYGGSASAELPLYFPTESTPVNEEDNTLDISVPDLLGFFSGDGGSVEITTPDLTAFPTPTLIGMLSNPEFIIDGLDSVLLRIQDALDGEIYGIELPLIGDGLAPAGQFIADFREDVLSYLSLKLREGGLNPVTLVQETLYNIFGDEGDGDPEAVRVLGFEPDDRFTGSVQAETALTSGTLSRDAELNVTVGREDTTRLVVLAENVDGDTPEALVEAFNNALRGRGLDDLLTAGYVENGAGGFFLTLTAANAGDEILIETAGAIPLDLFGLSVGGLGILQDAEGLPGGTVDVNDIVKSGFGLFDEFGQFDFLIGQDYVFGQSLDFDLGLPILDFDLDAGIEIDFGWDMAFGFGVSQEDGFYFVAGDDGDPATPDLLPGFEEELVIGVDVNLLGALGFSPGRATGDDFDEDPAAMTATGKLPGNGRLSGDVEFTLVVGNVVYDDLVVRANSTNNNRGVQDLVDDINAVLTARGIDPADVVARAQRDADNEFTGRLQFVTGSGADVAIFNSATAMGRLGFLVVEAVDGGRDPLDPLDPASYTGLTLTLAVDIADPGTGSAQDGRLTFSEISASSTQLSDILSASVDIDANVDLGLTVNFGGLGLDASFLPAIGTDLAIDWSATFDTRDGSDIMSPDVAFLDITLDLGSFISDFAGPYLADIGAFLEPLGFLLDRQDGLLYKRLPVISDLAGETVTLLTLAETLDREGKIVPFINAIEQIYFLTSLVTDAAREAEASDGGIILEFGDITLLSSELETLEDTGGTLSDLDKTPTPTTTVDDFNRSGGQDTQATRSFTRNVTRPGPGTINFAILQPGTVVSLLLGEPDVTLIEYDLPPFGFEFEYLQRFPIYPPLFATLRGFFSASVDLAFGYDTLGLNQFLASENPLDLINGFFVKDVDENGIDIPELTFYGGIAAGASLDIGVASAGVEGGIDASIFFNLNDPDQDTKVRLSEMLGNILLNNFNPIAIFDTTGRVDAFLRAYIEVLFGLWSADYEIARVNLASFDIPFKRPPILAQDIGDGTLQINMGTASENRIHGSLTDGDESIYASFDNGSVLLRQTANGPAQRFVGVERIVVDAGAGDDTIDLSGLGGSGIAIEVRGGTGDDEIIGATGSRNVIFGGEGDDMITGGSRADELHGGDGDDEIRAGGGNDLIVGGAGADLIVGGAGNDDIEGGDGDDRLDGGGGNDIYRFSGNWGDDEVTEDTETDAGLADTWDFGGTTTDIEFSLGADVRVGVVEDVVADGAALRVTATRHGLATGDQVDFSGIRVLDAATGMTVDLQGTATVTVAAGALDEFTIDLAGLPADFSYVGGTGIFQLDRSALAIERFANADLDDEEMPTGGEPLIQVETARRHGLESGDVVRIGGTAGGATVLDRDGNGQVAEYTVAVVDATTFNLLGTIYTDPPFALEDAFAQRDETGTGLVEGIGSGAAAGEIIVVSSDHGLSINDEIAIVGSATELNGRYTVSAVTDDSFTIVLTAPPAVMLADIDIGSAVWQLNRTTAESVGNSVFSNGYGIETIVGGRGGDVYDIYQTDAQQIVLDGAAGSDTYRAYAIESRIGQGSRSVTKLFDTGNPWDTDVTLFFGSESRDSLQIDREVIVTDIGSGDANPSFNYGEPNVVLGFQSGESDVGRLTAGEALTSGELDRPARFALTVGDGEATLVEVGPDDVGSGTVADLVVAINEAIATTRLAGTVAAVAEPDPAVGERIVFVATDTAAVVTIENLSQGSGIEALEVEALGGDDRVDVGSTNSRTSVRISGGLGDDAISVGGPADGNTTAITVNGIRGSSLTGPLLIQGNEGTNRLSVSDADDGAPNSGRLSDERLAGLGMQIDIEYEDMAFVAVQLGSGGDDFTIESTITGTTDVLAGAGADTVDIETVSGILNVGGEADADAITLQTSNAGSTTNIAGGGEADAIDVRSMQGDTNVTGDDGSDVISVSTTAGLGGAGTVNLINGLLDISGGNGVDTLNIDDTADGGLTLAAQRQLSSGAAERGRLSGDAVFELDFGDGSTTEIVVAADIGALRAAAAVAPGVQADGVLSTDAMFVLNVGAERFDVSVQRDTDNGSLADLLDDVNEALELVGIDAARVQARLDGDTLMFDSRQGEDLNLQVEADDTAATELGFADDSDAVFDNNAAADLEADINDALSAAGVAGQVSAAIDAESGFLGFTLLSGDFMRVISDDDGAESADLGLTSGQLIQPNNVGTLRISAATGRAELIGLGMGVPGDGLPGIVYDTMANVNIALGAGNDEFNVQGTLNDETPAIQSLTRVDTGGGDDVINVSNTAPAIEAGRGHLAGVLDDVQGELTVLGDTGFNTLNISDRDSTAADTGVLVTASRIEGLAPAAINYSAIDGFGGGVNLWAGRGDDVVRIESTRADDVTTLYANDGDDRVTIVDADPASADGLLVVEGGVGDDVIDGSSWNAPLFIFGDLGEVSYEDRTRALDRVTTVETIDIETGGADQLAGGSADDVLLGGIADDSASGGDGDDAVIGDGGRVRFEGGSVFQVEATDFFIGAGDMLAGGLMSDDSFLGGDGNDVIIGGAGLDLLFGTLAEDILIFEYGRVTYDENGFATTVIVLGQRPLDLAASEMFDLYLKAPFVVAPYLVGDVVAERAPIELKVIDVSTGATNYRNGYHNALCQKYSAEVAFELGSATLTAESAEYIRQAAGFLAGVGGVTVQVAGHADSLGPDALNQRLSLARAQAVVDALVGQGVNPAILKAAGFGETRPIADNATEAGRAENRRVEIEIDESGACLAPGEMPNEGASGIGILALAGWRSAQPERRAQAARRINW